MKKISFIAAAIAFAALSVIGCQNSTDDNSGGGATYIVTFNTVDTNGALEAKVGSETLTSGKKVAADKIVEFTAKPNEGYVIDRWTITGGAFEADTGKDGSDTAKVKVNSGITVKVSFKAATPGKHVLTFKVKGNAGVSTITAKLTDGDNIFSGNEVENGKEVVFTAVPDTHYKVMSWTIKETAGGAALSFTSGGNAGDTTAKAVINKVVTVEVTFEEIKHAVTFTAGANGALTAKVGEETITSVAQVGEGKTVEFTAVPNTGYDVDKWEVTGGSFETGTGEAGGITAKVTVNSDITVKVSFKKITYTVDATLSVYAPAMGLDLAKGQPDKGDKYKPLVEGARVTVDGDGKVMLTVKFRKSYVKVGSIEANTFIDPRNSHPGYYDMNGVKQDAPYTISSDDTADDLAGKKVHYVTSMTFPVSKEKSEYFLWLYLNSSVMGAQSGDGKGSAGPNAPNQHSKYEGKFTIDWSTLTKE